MNKELIITRFAKAANSYSEEATVQRRIAATMCNMFEDYLQPENAKRVLEIGCGTGIFSRMLLQKFHPEELFLNDICPEMEEQLTDICLGNVVFKAGDAESYPFPGRYHLITSCSAFQWFKYPAAFLDRISPLLEKEGLLAFSTFGEENMWEIKTLTGMGLDYFSLEEWQDMLSEKYDILYASEERIISLFDTPRDVLYHLKRTGVTGIKEQRWTKNSLLRFCDGYLRCFNKQGKVKLTYHPLYLIAKRKN